jgi:hypothetical protein
MIRLLPDGHNFYRRRKMPWKETEREQEKDERLEAMGIIGIGVDPGDRVAEAVIVRENYPDMPAGYVQMEVTVKRKNLAELMSPLPGILRVLVDGIEQDEMILGRAAPLVRVRLICDSLRKFDSETRGKRATEEGLL